MWHLLEYSHCLHQKEAIRSPLLGSQPPGHLVLGAAEQEIPGLIVLLRLSILSGFRLHVASCGHGPRAPGSHEAGWRVMNTGQTSVSLQRPSSPRPWPAMPRADQLPGHWRKHDKPGSFCQLWRREQWPWLCGLKRKQTHVAWPLPSKGQLVMASWLEEKRSVC